MAYEQFDMQPGKSTSLLNDDPEWSRFVHFDSDNEEELNAYFKRDEYENYVLRTAYEKGCISFRTIAESNGFELSIQVSEITTTYYGWAEKNEPVIRILARIISPVPIDGNNHCAFELVYLVRSPFTGMIDSFFRDRATNGGRLYKIYTTNRARHIRPIVEKFHLIFDNPDKLDHVDVRFNEYKFDENFWDGIPYFDCDEARKYPRLRYEWKVADFSDVQKGQHVCSIVKNPLSTDKNVYKIFSPARGIITIGLNRQITDYTCQANIYDSSNLFSIYKSKESLIKYHFFPIDSEEKDEFDGTISLYWNFLAGRKLSKDDDGYSIEDCPGFEMKADGDKYIIVSLEIKNNIPYIVFSVNYQKICLSNGDSVDMLFKDMNGDKSVLTFIIPPNSVQKDDSSLYRFYCKLSQCDIYTLMNNDCVSWRIRFGKQPLNSVMGTNESNWCPKDYAVDVFKSYAKRFMELVEELKEEYPIDFFSQKNAASKSLVDGTCHVYLMYDTSTGFYKIGISNNPEYRERTLQSEKPTIEKICAKEYPNRIIASAIENALHKAYVQKRIRGEWFALDANDVNAIIMTLS